MKIYKGIVMITLILNTTQETCVICHEDYQKKEIFDVTKVVELACHHFYHINCLSKAFRYQEARPTNLSCCYCTQEVALAALGVNAFADQEIFQARLEEIRGDYDYDNEVIEAASIVITLYTSLHDLSQTVPIELSNTLANPAKEEQKVGFSEDVYDLIKRNQTIKEHLKRVVMQILGTMMTGDRALRSVDDEAERWGSVPFENWPDKIKKNGVLVRYECQDARIRVSANHLKKVADKIFEDALVSLDYKKADNLLQSIHVWAPKVLGVVLVAILAKKILDRF